MPDSMPYEVTVGGTAVCATLGAHIEHDGFEMEPPSVRTSYVEVPGRDGSIDLTESLAGHPVYDDRTMRVSFFAMSGGRAAGEDLLARAMRLLHGKRAEIALSWDPDHTYNGRIAVSALKRFRRVVGFTMEARCEPFRFKERVSVSRDCAGGAWLELECGDAPAIPSWAVPVSASILMGDKAVELQAGTWKVPDLQLSPGTNSVFVATRGEGGTERVLSTCTLDTLAVWAQRQMSDWMWAVKPENGHIAVAYDYKEL